MCSDVSDKVKDVYSNVSDNTDGEGVYKVDSVNVTAGGRLC